MGMGRYYLWYDATRHRRSRKDAWNGTGWVIEAATITVNRTDRRAAVRRVAGTKHETRTGLKMG